MNFVTAQNKFFTNSMDILLKNDTIRNAVVKKGKKMIYQNVVLEDPDNRPQAILEARAKLIQNLLQMMNRVFSNGNTSPRVRKAVIRNLVGGLVMGEEDRTAAFQATYNFCPPSFLVIGPTKRCNLMCTGCYAASSAKDAETLSYDVFNRIIQEKKDLWGSYFTVITGGEPLLYRDGDKTIFDILENNPENYFMMYTNGTLITKEMAKRMADCGNLTPAISVEGFEKETDARRGKGTHKRIMTAMENLRNAGVPFGISITATRNNADVVLSDEFVDCYIKDQGAVYGWVFQYMPIGRKITTDLMITPEQRLALFQREQKMVQERDLFLVDFWNSGLYSVGCFSAGRAGGYFYIDWNGNIAPCAFMPYYVTNIYEIYRENKTLNDVLFSPYFTAIRDWQADYAYRQPPDKINNLITPCFMRDHFDTAYQTIKDFQAKGLDENAREAIDDTEYRRVMSDYGRNIHAVTQGPWEEFMGRSDAGKE